MNDTSSKTANGLSQTSIINVCHALASFHSGYNIEKEKGIHVDFDSVDKIIENVITVALRRFK